MPIERYGPNLKAFWEKAVLEPQTLRLACQKDVIRLRFRLYSFRSELYKDYTRAEEPAKSDLKAFWDRCQRVTLRERPDLENNPLGDPSKSWLLIAGHSDHQFDAILAKQGFAISDAPEEPL